MTTTFQRICTTEFRYDSPFFLILNSSCAIHNSLGDLSQLWGYGLVGILQEPDQLSRNIRKLWIVFEECQGMSFSIRSTSSSADAMYVFIDSTITIINHFMRDVRNVQAARHDVCGHKQLSL